MQGKRGSIVCHSLGPYCKVKFDHHRYNSLIRELKYLALEDIGVFEVAEHAETKAVEDALCYVEEGNGRTMSEWAWGKSEEGGSAAPRAEAPRLEEERRAEQIAMAREDTLENKKRMAAQKAARLKRERIAMTREDNNEWTKMNAREVECRMIVVKKVFGEHWQIQIHVVYGPAFLEDDWNSAILAPSKKIGWEKNLRHLRYFLEPKYITLNQSPTEAEVERCKKEVAVLELERCSADSRCESKLVELKMEIALQDPSVFRKPDGPPQQHRGAPPAHGLQGQRHGLGARRHAGHRHGNGGPL